MALWTEVGVLEYKSVALVDTLASRDFRLESHETCEARFGDTSHVYELGNG